MEHRGRGNFERQEPPAPYGRGRSSEPPFPPRDRGFDRGGFNDRGPSYGGPPGPGGNGGFDGPPRGGYDRGYDSRRPYRSDSIHGIIIFSTQWCLWKEFFFLWSWHD